MLKQIFRGYSLDFHMVTCVAPRKSDPAEAIEVVMFQLVDSDRAVVTDALLSLPQYAPIAADAAPYGCGDAAAGIVYCHQR